MKHAPLQEGEICVLDGIRYIAVRRKPTDGICMTCGVNQRGVDERCRDLLNRNGYAAGECPTDSGIHLQKTVGQRLSADAMLEALQEVSDDLQRR